MREAVPQVVRSFDVRRFICEREAASRVMIDGLRITFFPATRGAGARPRQSMRLQPQEAGSERHLSAEA